MDTEHLGSRSALHRRRWIGTLFGTLLVFQTGCYTLLPMQSTQPQAERIAVVVNDRGREVLREGVGSLLERIEGQPVASDSSSITMLVYRTENVRGESSTWTGERVTIPRDGIMGYQARKLSKVRTFALVGGVVGVILATAIGIKWNFGSDGPRDDGGGPIGESR